MSDIAATPNAITPQIILGALAGISARDTQTVLTASPVQSHTAGVAVLLSANLAQVQAAVGIRRPFNPYAY